MTANCLVDHGNNPCNCKLPSMSELCKSLESQLSQVQGENVELKKLLADNPSHADMDVAMFTINMICSERDSLQKEVQRYRSVLEKINTVGLDKGLGQIVGSEHYEKAWLDCVYLAGEALASQGE